MANPISTFDSRRSRWTDPKTGQLTREAEIFLRELWLRTGGAEGTESTTAQETADQALELAESQKFDVFGKRESPWQREMEFAQLISQTQAFLRRSPHIPDVRAGTNISVTKDAQGYTVGALNIIAPESDQNILASRIFGGK